MHQWATVTSFTDDPLAHVSHKFLMLTQKTFFILCLFLRVEIENKNQIFLLLLSGLNFLRKHLTKNSCFSSQITVHDAHRKSIFILQELLRLSGNRETQRGKKVHGVARFDCRRVTDMHSPYVFMGHHTMGHDRQQQWKNKSLGQEKCNARDCIVQLMMINKRGKIPELPLIDSS